MHKNSVEIMVSAVRWPISYHAACHIRCDIAVFLCTGLQQEHLGL